MSIIVCGQDDVIPDECVSCGGWLHATQRGGLVGPHGWRFCSLPCIDDQVDREADQEASFHLNVRDLLCDCAICTEHGLPTDEMRAEYAAHATSQGSTTPSGSVFPDGGAQ